MAGRREVWSVRDLSEQVGQLVARGFPNAAWVRGEISGYRVTQAGHAFFRLADRGDPNHTLPCVIWSKTRAGMDKYLRRHGVELRDGVEVETCGRVTYSARGGTVQLNVTAVDPEFTAGRQAVERDALLRDLRRQGLFDANRARPLTAAPLRVGLVTAGDSAAYHDVLGVLQASGLALVVVRADAVVQGTAAPHSIAGAIQTCVAAGVDMVMLTRGGGSRSDLTTFDSRVVAMAIASSTTPVWCGVGHDIDRSVADEVAHRSFPTPTALATAVVERVLAAADRSEDVWHHIQAAATKYLTDERAVVAYRARHTAQAVRDALQYDRRFLDRAADQLRHQPADLLARAEGRHLARAAALVARAGQTTQEARAQTDRARRDLRHGTQRCVERAAARLALADATCAQADPARLTRRGWTYATAAGVVVRSTVDVAPGTIVRTHVADGWIDSTVIDTRSTRSPQQSTPPT